MKLITEHIESGSGKFGVSVRLLEENPGEVLLIRRMSNSSRTASADTESHALLQVGPLREKILEELGRIIRHNTALFRWVSQPIKEEPINLDQL
jgi:hypothetical protein